MLFVCFTYGLVTLFIVLLTSFPWMALVPRLYDEDNWTVLKEILHTLFNVSLVAIGNLFLSAYYGFYELSLEYLLVFWGYTMAVGFLPLTFEVLIRQIIYQKQNQRKSEAMESDLANRPRQNEELVFENEDGKVVFQVKKDQVFFLESADNYVIVYFKSEDQIEKEIIRNSLARFEEMFQGKRFFRSHRSYLVNLDCVEHVSGNARGYNLKFSDAVKTVPVARRKLKDFETVMKTT